MRSTWALSTSRAWRSRGGCSGRASTAIRRKELLPRATETLETDEAATVGQALVTDELTDSEDGLDGRAVVAGIVQRQRHVLVIEEAGIGAQQRHADVHAVGYHVIDELEVARLEHVQGQDHAREEDDVGQGKDGQIGQDMGRRLSIRIQHRFRGG